MDGLTGDHGPRDPESIQERSDKKMTRFPEKIGGYQ